MEKKKLGLLLAFALANTCLLFGCGKSVSSNDANASTATETDDLLSQIQSKGTITFAMEGQWAPWTYHDESGELVGFDTEVGMAIADKLGVKAEFVEGEWDGLFTGLDTGRYDAIINGVEVTDERAEKYDFTEPYAYIRTALVVADTNSTITTFEDLNGIKTSNSLGSTYATLAESYGASVENVDTLSETIDMITSGRVDATLNAEVSIYDYLKEKPNAPIKIVALTDDASLVSIPLRKGAETESLRNAINEALKELQEDGTLSELSNKYFGSDITKAN